LRRIGKWLLIAVGAFIVLGIIASMGSPDDETADATVSPSVAQSESQAPAEEPNSEEPTPEPTAEASVAAATPAPTPEPQAEFDFEDGTHTVGTDVQPGTYRGEGGTFCYWERLSGFSGEFEDIIANGTGDHPHVVTIADSDEGFSTEDCGGWTDDLAQITDSVAGPIGEGTFIVGTDIAPGTYGAPGGQFCYWERLSGFSGEFGDIIANGTGESNQVVTIADGDVGFHTSGCGDWSAR
jgi:hypothetical protein